MLALVNGRTLIEGAFRDGLAVLVDGSRIAAVVPHDDVPATAERRDLAGAMLVPGLIDTQVNGGGDALFNDDPSVATIRRIGESHARFGTTGFLPTLISDDDDVIRAAIAAVGAAIAEGVPGVLGIHIEGPFINVARRGIHAADKIRTMDPDGVALLSSLRAGRTLVTLAPELAGAAVIAQLVAAGVVVAAGHTAATYADMRVAFDAGMSGVTHLFNAMSQLSNREPGAVGAALEDARAYCGLIVDGHHVHAATLRLALRCKPADRVVLVTDAMPTTGGVATSFRLNGAFIRVDGGRLVDEAGTLAGAHLDMLTAVRNTHELLGVPLATAFAMASTIPAAFIGVADELGTIAAGKRASLIAVDADWRLTASLIDGVERAYASPP